MGGAEEFARRLIRVQIQRQRLGLVVAAVDLLHPVVYPGPVVKAEPDSTLTGEIRKTLALVAAEEQAMAPAVAGVAL